MMLLLIKLVEVLYTLYTLMIFARILSSWIPELQNTRILHFIAFYTDPYLNLFRRMIPPLGMLDLSPIIAFLCLGLIKYVLIQILVQIHYLLF